MILDHVNFQIRKGQTIGLVGESGCGKTTVAKSILQLLPKNATGEILFEGENLMNLKGETLRKKRKKIQMIFQDPYSSLNPRKTIGAMIGEPLTTHNLAADKKEYDKKIEYLMEIVGLNPGMKDRYAHELSGGQRQRVGIARALASDPQLIVCDEPISALDVSIQAQIINLLEELQKKLGLTYLFIAHDLSVVKHISDVIAVMYLGKIVEMASCEDLYNNPTHPYTKALLAAIPIADPFIEETREHAVLDGEVPSVLKRPAGCSFSDRCRFASEECRKQQPSFKEIEKGHFVACDRLEEVKKKGEKTIGTFTETA